MDTVSELLKKKRGLQLEFDESCERFESIIKNTLKWVMIDKQTGLFTKQAFEEQTAVRLAHRNERENLSIFEIQLYENFATHGTHDCDAAKKEFANLLKASVRASDICTQCARNIFLLLTIGVTSTDAMKIQTRLVKKFTAHHAVIGHASTNLGFATYVTLLGEAHQDLAWNVHQKNKLI